MRYEYKSIFYLFFVKIKLFLYRNRNVRKCLNNDQFNYRFCDDFKRK